MCLTASAIAHGADEGLFPFPVPVHHANHVRVLNVQEAIFYRFGESLVHIVLTAVIETREDFPVDVWFFHAAAVRAGTEDITNTIFAGPADDPYTSALSLLPRPTLIEGEYLSLGSISEGLIGATSGRQYVVLPRGKCKELTGNQNPFVSIGFGPLDNPNGTTRHVVRFSLTIKDEVFEQLITKRQNSQQFFFEISGPGIVLDDIDNAYVPTAPEEIREAYDATFKRVALDCHIPTQRYEIVTFDDHFKTEAITYSRALLAADHQLRNHALETDHLGKMSVNSWDSSNERFMILRASVHPLRNQSADPSA